jgi:hypothetical protein
MAQNMAWPIGYPAVALGSYAPMNEERGIRITKGDTFKVIGDMRVPGTQIQVIRIEYPSNPVRRGWVRREAINIGKRARVGEPIAVVTETAPTINLIGATITPNNPAGKVWRTVTSLIDAFYTNRDSLPQYNRDLDTVKKQPNEAANQIFEGFRLVLNKQGRTQLDTLSQSAFTVQNLANVEEIHRGDKTEWWIIYLIVYHFSDRLPELYDGKSIRPGIRKRSHIDATKTPAKTKHSIHYNAAREATSFAMVPICALPTNTKWLFLAEQVVQSMLQTTARLYTSEATAPIPTAADVHDIQHSAGSFAADRKAGSILKQISDRVFAAELWPGGTERPSFGSTVGLNARSALTETNIWSKTGWTVSHTKGQGTTIRRAGKRVKANGTVFTIGTLLKIYLTNAQLDIIGVNTEIHVVFELKDNDAEHEYCYARLPDLFGTNDVAKANSWGVRVEWRDGNMWKALYLQCESHAGLRAPYRDVRAALAPYRSGITIYHFLKHQAIHPGPELAFLTSPTVMKGVVSTFDYLDQTVKVKDLGQPRDVSQQDGPRLLNKTQVEANIRAKIDTSMRTDIGVDTHTGRAVPCDNCRIHVVQPVCGSKDGACPRCVAYNTICTFSDFDRDSTSALATALRLKPLRPSQILIVPDPSIHMLWMDEEADIDDEGMVEADEDED